MSSIFDDIPLTPDPLAEQIEELLKWVVEDHGESAMSSLIRDLLIAVKHSPELSIEDIIYGVSLDWSK